MLYSFTALYIGALIGFIGIVGIAIATASNPKEISWDESEFEAEPDHAFPDNYETHEDYNESTK